MTIEEENDRTAETFMINYKVSSKEFPEVDRQLLPNAVLSKLVRLAFLIVLLLSIEKNTPFCSAQSLFIVLQ